jgi:hypothetical protein
MLKLTLERFSLSTRIVQASFALEAPKQSTGLARPRSFPESGELAIHKTRLISMPKHRIPTTRDRHR